MQHLVRQGMAYVRSVHGAPEPPRRLDLNAFIESLARDYQDIGKAVSLFGRVRVPIVTGPHSLRRALGNLIDNALKYAGAAELLLENGCDQYICIKVADRGPGIPAEELEAVMQPFYRAGALGDDTRGAGLGLSIVQHLSAAIGSKLTLQNRDGGGLIATLTVATAAGR